MNIVEGGADPSFSNVFPAMLLAITFPAGLQGSLPLGGNDEKVEDGGESLCGTGMLSKIRPWK